MADFKHIKVKRDPNQQDLKIDDICFVELLVVNRVSETQLQVSENSN